MSMGCALSESGLFGLAAQVGSNPIRKVSELCTPSVSRDAGQSKNSCFKNVLTSHWSLVLLKHD